MFWLVIVCFICLGINVLLFDVIYIGWEGCLECYLDRV